MILYYVHTLFSHIGLQRIVTLEQSLHICHLTLTVIKTLLLVVLFFPISEVIDYSHLSRTYCFDLFALRILHNLLCACCQLSLKFHKGVIL